MQRLRALTEAECYARCYAAKSDTVRVVNSVDSRNAQARSDADPRRRRYEPHVSGELVRQHFEALLESRDPAELAEPEAA